jgi:hypothetical protein
MEALAPAGTLHRVYRPARHVRKPRWCTRPSILSWFAPVRVIRGEKTPFLPQLSSTSNCHPNHARQIRDAILHNFAAGPRNFSSEKNLPESEFGHLFVSAPRAYSLVEV